MALLPDPTATLTGEGRAIYDHILTRRAAKGVLHLGPYIPLLNHPLLAQCIEELGYFYKYQGVLPRDVYQFIVLLVAKRSAVAFVWQDHIAAARTAGLADSVIQVIEQGQGSFEAPYDIVYETAGCAFAYQSIPTELQDSVIRRFGVQELIEIVTLCGFYSLMGMVNACFDVTEPDHGGR